MLPPSASSTTCNHIGQLKHGSGFAAATSKALWPTAQDVEGLELHAQGMTRTLLSDSGARLVFCLATQLLEQQVTVERFAHPPSLMISVNWSSAMLFGSLPSTNARLALQHVL